MSTFVCDSPVSQQPWFGSSNTLLPANYCGQNPDLNLRLFCTHIAISGIKSLSVDVQAGRETQGTLSGPPPIRVNAQGGNLTPPIAGPSFTPPATSVWYSGILLHAIHDEVNVLSIYKSDVQHYSNTNVYQQNFPAQILNNGVCGTVPVADIGVRAATVFLSWGVQSFDFEIYAVNCYNCGPTAWCYNFYIKYENVVGYIGPLQGFTYVKSKAFLSINCPTFANQPYVLGKIFDHWDTNVNGGFWCTFDQFGNKSCNNYGPNDCANTAICQEAVFIENINVNY